MSGETTPVLSGTIPAFETFMSQWEVLGEKHPRLKPWVDIGLKWATTYYARMDLTKAYIISMSEFFLSIQVADLKEDVLQCSTHPYA